MVSARKNSQDDFENRYLDLFEDTVKGMDKKIDRLDDSVSGLNRKVNRLENEVFPHQASTVKDLPSWWRDPSIIKLLTLVTGAIILIVSLIAALFGKSLPSLF